MFCKHVQFEILLPDILSLRIVLNLINLNLPFQPQAKLNYVWTFYNVSMYLVICAIWNSRNVHVMTNAKMSATTKVGAR
jgi:hypothetical protein